ncbi:hypothetical protein [Hafnia alvei]|uniref:hypothetical protein n=1 Tax=Hafnia alvei TaxID=569 RepID=UPI00061D3150|nr:hypothetical protein [Hafnia alvei]KKF38324.1 hypothetical protein PU01_24215 [Hafnia alvei]MBW3478286.1 hypothetical protein [Hafnia alvei]
MTSREQFEAECLNGLINGGLAKHENGKYASELTDAVWRGWQASREALEVEIDNHTEFEIEHMICPDKDGYSVGWIDGRNYAVKQVRTAGIKVKGE